MVTGPVHRPLQAPAATLLRLLADRRTLVVAAVVMLHAAAIWAWQPVAQPRPAEVIVPAQILASMVAPPVSAPEAEPAPATLASVEPRVEATPEPPKPEPAPEPPPPEPEPAPEPPPPPKAEPVPKPVAKTKPQPRPRPKAQAPKPTPVRPAVAETAAQPAHAATATPPQPVAAAPIAQASSGPVAPAAPTVVQPSSSAAYLKNPPPPYPAVSRRLGQSGRVVIRVLIGTDGRAQQARIERSSGYDRLDQVALETARDRWRYVPGTRGGVPEAMWFNVPINFVLE